MLSETTQLTSAPYNRMKKGELVVTLVFIQWTPCLTQLSLLLL